MQRKKQGKKREQEQGSEFKTMIEKIATKLSPFLIAGGLASAVISSEMGMANYFLQTLIVGGELAVAAVGGGVIGKNLLDRADKEAERQRAYSEIEQKLDAKPYH